MSRRGKTVWVTRLYQVSDWGRVFNLRSRKFLRGTVTASGYRQVQLSRPGSRPRFRLVHALVLEAFVGPRPPGLVCDHLSADKLDNSRTNLEWVTPAENVRRAARAGLLRTNPPRGERHYKAKLTDCRVKAIRTKRRNGVSTRQLAREYGVSLDTVRKVVSRVPGDDEHLVVVGTDRDR